jgi:hypothetical protein
MKVSTEFRSYAAREKETECRSCSEEKTRGVELYSKESKNESLEVSFYRPRKLYLKVHWLG